MTMPLLFLFLRVALVVTAFQLRFSLARVRNVLPPTTAVEWLTSAGQVRGLQRRWAGGGAVRQARELASDGSVLCGSRPFVGFVLLSYTAFGHLRQIDMAAAGSDVAGIP